MRTARHEQVSPRTLEAHAAVGITSSCGKKKAATTYADRTAAASTIGIITLLTLTCIRSRSRRVAKEGSRLAAAHD